MVGASVQRSKKGKDDEDKLVYFTCWPCCISNRHWTWCETSGGMALEGGNFGYDEALGGSDESRVGGGNGCQHVVFASGLHFTILVHLVDLLGTVCLILIQDTIELDRFAHDRLRGLIFSLDHWKVQSLQNFDSSMWTNVSQPKWIVRGARQA